MAQAAECEKRTEIQSIFVSGYETSASNIQENFYLKHIIVNNTVSESYACMRYNTNNEICLRGGDMSYYGTYDGMSSTQINSLEGRHPTKNFAILESIRSYFEGNSGLCFFDDNQAGCYDSSLCLSMTYYDDDYIVSSNNTDGPSIFCYVDIDGSSECS